MEINEKFITNSKYTTDEKCVYLNILISSDDYICNKSQLIISKELNISRTNIIKACSYKVKATHLLKTLKNF